MLRPLGFYFYIKFATFMESSFELQNKFSQKKNPRKIFKARDLFDIIFNF